MASGGQLRAPIQQTVWEEAKSIQGDAVIFSLPPLLPPPRENMNTEHLQGNSFPPWDRGKESGSGSEGGYSVKAFLPHLFAEAGKDSDGAG